MKTLFVVSCTKSKAWDNDKAAPRLLPAQEAYTGSVMKEWLASPESKTEKWLILSAKFGLIEPDLPIPFYDVTWNDPSSGPLPKERVAEQIREQKLSEFERVVVRCGRNPHYCGAIRKGYAAANPASLVECGCP